MARIQEINVAVVVEKEGKVLLLKRKNGLWELPGGGVEWGERPEEAVVREGKEECGVEIKKVELLGVSSATYKKNGNDKHSIYIGYVAKEWEGEVKISEEHLEGRWVGREEWKKLKIALNSLPLLQLFFSSSSKE